MSVNLDNCHPAYFLKDNAVPFNILIPIFALLLNYVSCDANFDSRFFFPPLEKDPLSGGGTSESAVFIFLEKLIERREPHRY